MFGLLTAGRRNIPADIRMLYMPRSLTIRRLLYWCYTYWFRHVVWLPTDTLDGAYIPQNCNILTRMLSRLQHGRHIYCIGFSFRSNPSPQLQNHFKGMDNVFFAARDGASQKHFEAYSGQRTALCADIAYCLETLPLPHALEESLADIQSRSDYVIGINISSHYMNTLQVSQDAVVQALRTLLKNRIGLVWIPSDFRNKHNSDLHCHKRITALFSPDEQKQMMVLNKMLHPRIIKALLGRLDSLITGRMHLLIMALSMNKKPFAISYHEKFRNELNSWQLDDHLIQDFSLLPGKVMDSLKNPASPASQLLAEKQRLALGAFNQIA